MTEWRDPTDAEVDDALGRHPGLPRERAVRLARAEAWQRDRGLMAPLPPLSRGDGRMRDKDGKMLREPGARTSSFEATTHKRGDGFLNVHVKPPDGVTFGKGEKARES
jgi:hypothetical protein